MGMGKKVAVLPTQAAHERSTTPPPNTPRGKEILPAIELPVIASDDEFVQIVKALSR